MSGAETGTPGSNEFVEEGLTPMNIAFVTAPGRIPAQASAGVRLATLSDEALLWELGLLHASRAAGMETSDEAERIVDLEREYVRRHPLRESVLR